MNNLNTSKKRAVNAGTASLQRYTHNTSISTASGTFSKLN